MGVPKERAAEVLAKCGRHCCVCRRFRPTQLQVHHIVERALGGTNDLDNLIAICVSCHSDVHTNTKLSRRFTPAELKLHRENVYRLVHEGRLPSGSVDIDDIAAATAAAIQVMRSRENPSSLSAEENISLEPLDILLSAIAGDGSVTVSRYDDTVSVRAGHGNYLYRAGYGAYPASVSWLLSRKLLHGSANDLQVTTAGYVLADDIVAANPSYTLVKAKCLACGLHFIVCTWSPEEHSSGTLFCPECGQHKGAFLTWCQRMFGFIFQMVPGRHETIAGSTVDIKQQRPD